MKLTIIYDNSSTRSDLTADWGWSCFIETSKRNILFDTGGNGKILLKNMQSLGITPESVDDVVISHPDFDHIGGLSAFLNSNQTAVIHVPFSFRGIRYTNSVKYYDKPTRIYENIFVTGELNKREQAIAINTKNGLVLIIGCGHPGIENIMNAVSDYGNVYAIIGGLHGFNDFQILRNVHLICSTHCTKHQKELKALYPEKYIEGGVGRIIKLAENND